MESAGRVELDGVQRAVDAGWWDGIGAAWVEAIVTELRREMERRRLDGCAMLVSGTRQSVVARQCAVSRTTASRWAAAAERGADLRARKPPGRPARLTAEQLRQVHLLWETRGKWTGAEFAMAIAQSVGVAYHPDHVCRLMVRLGLRAKRDSKREPEISPEAWGRMFEEMAHA
jgi:putative transposase